MRWSLLASIAVLAVLALPTRAQNLVSNGGFESGSTGWTSTGTITVLPVFARTGTRAHAFASATTNTLQRNVTLDAGSYTVSFYYAPASGTYTGTQTVGLTASFGDTQLLNVTGPFSFSGTSLAAPYAEASSVVTVAAGTYSLLFTGTTTLPAFAAYLVDDVSITIFSPTSVIGTLSGTSTASTRVATESSRGFMETVFGRMGLGGGETGTSTLGFGRNQITVATLGPDALQALGLTHSQGGPAADGVGVPHVWFAGFGGMSRVRDGNTLTSERGGTVFGADMRLSPSLLVGVSGGFGAADFGLEEQRNGGRSTDAQVGLYASWQPGLLDGLYLNGLLSYGRTEIETYRSGAGASGQLQSSFTIPSVQVSAEAGRPFATELGAVTPFARLSSTMLWRPGYSETQANGASGLTAVSVESATVLSGQSVLGARLAGDVDVAGERVRLTGELGWGHQFNRNPAITFRAAGANATQSATGIAPPADTAQLGLGARLLLDGGPELFTTYSGQYGAAYQDHLLFLGFRLAL